MSRSIDSQSVSDDAVSSVCSSEINNNDVFSVSNSYTAEHKKKKERLVNPHIHVLHWKRRNGKRVQYHKITVYSTPNIPGALIVNAETGSKYDLRVGKSDEDLFFSTLLATGDCGSQAPLLFYDNPEQYETHLMTEVPMETKRAWYVRYYELLANRERNNQTKMTLAGRRQDATGTIVK